MSDRVMLLIKYKLALITGGASGIGLSFAKELLRSGLTAVTLADINGEKGDNAVQEITTEFGENRAIFVKTDVAVKQQLEDAFLKHIKVFKNLDIVINNAGVCCDKNWENMLSVNINGCANGILLALEYLPKFRQADTAIIINISSVAGLDAFEMVPLYSASKHAIIGLSRSFGSQNHYNRTGVQVLAICPGRTDTPIQDGIVNRTLGPEYKELYESYSNTRSLQRPSVVAQGLIHVISVGETGSVWIVEDNETYEVEFLPRKMRLKLQK